MGIIQTSIKIKQFIAHVSFVCKFLQVYLNPEFLPVHLNPAKKPMSFHILTLVNKSPF